jgi:hypothetical protein
MGGHSLFIAGQETNHLGMHHCVFSYMWGSGKLSILGTDTFPEEICCRQVGHP